MPFHVRPIRAEELRAYFSVMGTAFLDQRDPDALAEEVAPLWDLSRAWAAFDAGRLVGTFRSWSTRLTVPGNDQVPAAAVTNVTVLPTHRRRGVLTQMTAAEHAAARERGEIAAILHAAEFPIYGRFGYGPATWIGTWTVDGAHHAFRRPLAGSVELVAPKDARTHLVTVFETWRARQPGEIARRDYRWDIDLGLRGRGLGAPWKGLVALHRDDAGDVDGYVRYRTEEKWEQNLPRGVVTVDELHALTDDAFGALWRFVGELDLVGRIRAEFRSVHDGLRWLFVNSRVPQLTDVSDGLWVRLLDVPAALAARRYERADGLTLEVVDPEARDGRVRLRLDGGPSGATATPTTQSPDLTIGVGALGAAYLGGTRLRDAAAPAGYEEHRSGALARADALFRTADDPWCSTFF